MRGGKATFSVGLALVCAMLRPAPATANNCDVVLVLETPVTVGAMQLIVDYSDFPGELTGMPNGMPCKVDAPDTLAPFSNDLVLHRILASFVSLEGMDGPIQVAHCPFSDPSGSAASSSFDVFVTEATDLAGDPLSRLPRVTAQIANCDDETTTTTTSSSTTTLPACGNGAIEDGEECDDGNAEAGDGCGPDCLAEFLCGDVNGNDLVQASDALLVLRAAIGEPIVCPAVLCDADGDSTIRASDSLRVLKRAVGASVVMACPTS